MEMSAFLEAAAKCEKAQLIYPAAWKEGGIMPFFVKCGLGECAH